VTVDRDGSDLEIRLTSTSAASARATLEDLLACLQAAERARRAGAGESAAETPSSAGKGP